MSRVAVCFGGPSPEHDISILTGLQAAHALERLGDDPIALYWSPAGAWHSVPATSQGRDFADGLPSGSQEVALRTGPGGGFVQVGRRSRSTPLDVSVVVNCCHGAPGEDGTLQALFDLAGLRYTGPDHAGAALAMDKLAFTGAVAAAGLPTLGLWPVADGLSAGGTAAALADGPLIVKPRFGGSSIGIDIVEDLATAKALAATSPSLAGGAVVQPYLADAIDLNLSLLAWPTLRLSAVERPERGADGGAGSAAGAIYSYADKYLLSGDDDGTGDSAGLAGAARELPADVPEPIAAAIAEAAVAVAELAAVRSVSRLDFLWDGTDDPAGLLVNELNTIPGSLAWYFWSEQGMSFAELLTNLVDEAQASPPRRFVTEGADGTALRSVRDIASKLA